MPSPYWQNPRHILVAVLLSSVSIWVSPAAAQYACSGNSPGQRMVGMSPGGNGVASVPLCVDDPSSAPQAAYSGPPVVWMDSYMAVAWHPDAADGWIASGFGSFDAAGAAALDACRQAMGDGCAVGTGVRDGSLALARDEGGALWGDIGENVRAAKKAALKSCRKGGGTHCKVIRTATASPWPEVVGGPPMGNPMILPPEGEFHREYGSVAWVDSKTTDGRWGSTVWVSTGRHKAEESAAAAVDACQTTSGRHCVVVRTVVDAALTIATDTADALHIGSSRVYKTARKDAEKRCRKTKTECTVTAVYDVRQFGDWVHDSSAALKAVTAK